MKYKLFILMLTLLILLPMGSTQQTSLGATKVGDCVEILQTCSNCTYVNITSLNYPNKSAVFTDAAMARDGFRYTLDWCNTTIPGEYLVGTVGDIDGVNTAVTYTLHLTADGTMPSTSKSIVYFIIALLSLIFFGLSLYGAIKLKWSNPRAMDGTIVGVSDLKYLKLFLWFITYLLLIFITFAFKNVSLITDWDTAYKFFSFLSTFLLVFLFPTFIIVFTTGFIKIFADKKVRRQIERNIRVR